MYYVMDLMAALDNPAYRCIADLYLFEMDVGLLIFAQTKTADGQDRCDR
jgi:hypothetical protein